MIIEVEDCSLRWDHGDEVYRRADYDELIAAYEKSEQNSRAAQNALLDTVLEKVAGAICGDCEQLNGCRCGNTEVYCNQERRILKAVNKALNQMRNDIK